MTTSMSSDDSSGFTFEEIEHISSEILRKTKIKPKIGVICGSGLGCLADHIEKADVIPYTQIPEFPTSTVAGHEGKLIFGIMRGKNVVLMQGRFHYYEGYSMYKVALPVRVMRAMGVTTLILTNAAGGLNPGFQVGDLMLIMDHIDLPGLTGECVLIGKNDNRFGPRFPSMINTYDDALRKLAKSIAIEKGLKSPIREGTYIMIGGPSFETVAESRLLRMFGADAVGMSTVPEAVVAKHAGMRVFGISLITDVCAMDYHSTSVTTHEEVLEVGKNRAQDLQDIVLEMIKRMSV